jgi:hypothetical protein
VELVHTTVGKHREGRVDGDDKNYNTTTTTILTNVNKQNIKYIEDFCPVHFTWSGDCVANYEKIYMANGTTKEVGELEIGDVVLSYDFEKGAYCYKKITNLWEKGELPIYRVHLRNGTTVDVTENHPMWIKTNRRYGDSKYSKMLLSEVDLTDEYANKTPVATKIPYVVKDVEKLTEDDGFVEDVAIKKIEALGIKSKVRDFEVEGTHSYVFQNGLIGHNCEDVSAFIAPLTLRTILQCGPLIDREKFPALWDVVHEILAHYGNVGNNALMGTERRSVETVETEKSAHMASLLFRHDYFASLPVLYLSSTHDRDLFNVKHKQYWSQFAKPTERSAKFPPVLLCEGTGIVHPTYSNITTTSMDPRGPKTRLKDHCRLLDCVKEPLEFQRGKTIPFYRYVFEVLTNHFIDVVGIPVQSFILTYNKKQTTQITLDPNAFDRGNFVYGVEFTDLLDGSPDICLIATPSIPKEHIEHNRTIALHQMPYPLFYMDTKTMLPVPWVDDTTFMEAPLVATRKILMDLKTEYRNWFLEASLFGDDSSSSNDTTTDDNDKLLQRRALMKKNSTRMLPLMVAPKYMKALLTRLYEVYGNQKNFEDHWYGFQIVHYFSNLSTCIVWICMPTW